MMAKRFGDAQPTVSFGPAAWTGTVLLDRLKVIGEDGASEVDYAVRSDGIAEALAFCLVKGYKIRSFK
jgi:hypothetical protein